MDSQRLPCLCNVVGLEHARQASLPLLYGCSRFFQLRNGGKSCWFDCHRRWLPSAHPFRRDRKGFSDGSKVLAGPPPELTGEEIWEQVRHFPTVYEGSPFRPTNRKISGFGITHNWVKRSIFWELPYLKTWTTIQIATTNLCYLITRVMTSMF